ncbi:hypothetical protein O181_130485 [Austropuccinia psidii MF-1]|uniref:Uncharacterized protein n=1 Tax=Austropuccinia psidii MF-1 TaxID=1389203 RepID=A0A9Q3L3S1_9BASI|nr:hypothetical protein [Austropuccinia psidii MF-1]
MGFGAKIGSGGPNCGLGASGPPPLATFGLIGLGQKGPNWPTDCGIWTMDRGGHRGPKWPKKAIYARTPLNEKDWSKPNDDG